MSAECTWRTFEFHGVGRRQITTRFDGGEITSNGGALLLREVERRTHIVRGLADGFTDHRSADRIEHAVEELVAQRVFGLALGYEDLNDHDDLRRDPLLAAAIGKRGLSGKDRRRNRDSALADKSTLNRLEVTSETASSKDRYKKIEIDFEAVDRLLVQTFLRAHRQPPTEIILDLDATDDPLHGKQESRFFHGYYDEYCYLPLYIFCGDHLLGARLREANIDASAGSLDELAGIVAEMREAWPNVAITIRADSGFCRDEVMTWCEDYGIGFVLGIARNPRLLRMVKNSLRKAMLQCAKTNAAVRSFEDLRYRTQGTWSRRRRVVAKCEALPKGKNPRFIVTSFSKEAINARTLYEDVYCARGEMENKIKEQQRFLFADRTSTHLMRSNQVRLCFSSIAYLLLSALRRIGLAGTEMATAQCDTIRSKLLKIGARIRITFRRNWISFASGCPYATIFDYLGRDPPA